MNELFEYQRRVSELAYKIWLAEGCPEHRGAEHWNRAVEIIAGQDERAARSPIVFTAVAAE